MRPLLCCICQRGPATFHITQRAGEAPPVRVDLCEACAREHRVDQSPPGSLREIFLKYGRPEESQAE